MTADDSQANTAGSADAADEDEVGINFVDILFALVIGEALLALNRALHMPAAGIAHLIFAMILTVTSWVGYHRSAYRYTGSINFNVHKPAGLVHLAKFLLDIVLVILYWVAVQTAEWGFSPRHQSPSYRWSTAIAASVFFIYVLWDLLSWASKGVERGAWNTSRRRASVIFFIMVLLVMILSFIFSPTGNSWVAAIDSTLIVLVLLYRVAKDWA